MSEVRERGDRLREDARMAHLAAVVDTSSDAIVSKTLDGVITSWNASAERMFGYRSDEIVGRSVRVLIPDERQQEEDEILAQLRMGIPIEHYETVRLTKDGARLDVSLSISPIKGATGETMGASKIIRDITARKRTEDALAAATAKFESVFNQSGIFAGILDTGGNLVEINALALDACGYQREDVLGRPFWETPWWRGSEQVQAQIRVATEQAAAGGVFRETLSYWLGDGSERVVDFAMHPIRDESGWVRFLHPTGVDITARVQVEAALRAQEAEEREIAIGLQQALLPTGLATTPGLTAAAWYEAGSDVLEVGGDWYDAFALPGGRVALTVGDVVGHGLAAAAAMGQLRTALAALAEHSDGPGQLLGRLDGYLARTGTTDFATVSYAVLDPSTGVLEYASAGHLPILMVSDAGEVTWLGEGRSGPLTGRDGGPRPQATATIEPGALLVFYSDGLVERRGERLTEGLDRLAELGETLRNVPVGDVCDALAAGLGVDTSREDDVAILAVCFAPVETFRRTFPARADELRALRESMRGWLEEHELREPALGNALLLAVGEACANAIEHAYPDGDPGEVDVEIAKSQTSLTVRVSDSGRFRVSSEPTPDRGRGTEIMRRLSVDFERQATTAGTLVSFRIPIEELLPT
jgi:PAS domain S-box-containing protein